LCRKLQKKTTTQEGKEKHSHDRIIKKLVEGRVDIPIYKIRLKRQEGAYFFKNHSF